MPAIFSRAARSGGQGCPPDSHSLEGCATTLRRWGGGLFALVLALGGVAAPAAEVAAKASLSRSVTVIGEPVQFQIKVTGAKRVDDIPDVTVDGLEVRYARTETRKSGLLDFGVIRGESSTTYLYEVTPEKNGTFTFPAITVDVDGQALQTQPVALTVQPSSVDDATRPRAQGVLELVIPKKTAYVGEMIPIELRLYVDVRVRWQPAAMPEISGEGFTRQKMVEPRRTEQVTRNGNDYDVLVFKTAIAAGKAGKISVGPVEMIYNAQVPRAKRKAPRSFFDQFGDDLFNDPIFAQTQQVKVKAEAVELTVKPLPAAGQPRGFSGAVGNFQFAAEGSPSAVQVGDPVTMRMRISGRGNFDRVEAPSLNDPAGWRSYPPSGSFKKDEADEVGMTGTKTFSMAVVPEEVKTQMPGFLFSYFDPEAEKYVTLASDPAPLKVTGSKVPAASTPKPAAPAPDPVVTPPPPPAAAADILGPLYTTGARKSFTPLYSRREFWLAQIVPAVLLLLLTALRLRGRPNAEATRTAALRREKAALLARLQDGGLAHHEFFDAAARVAQLTTALATGAEAAGVDAGAAQALADADTAEVLEEVFNERAELHFAGVGRADRSVSGDARARVLSALQKFGRDHAKS